MNIKLSRYKFLSLIWINQRIKILQIYEWGQIEMKYCSAITSSRLLRTVKQEHNELRSMQKVRFTIHDNKPVIKQTWIANSMLMVKKRRQQWPHYLHFCIILSSCCKSALIYTLLHTSMHRRDAQMLQVKTNNFYVDIKIASTPDEFYCNWFF